MTTKSSPSTSIAISSNDIAWKSDRDKKFQQKNDQWMQNNCARYGDQSRFSLAGFQFDWATAQARAAVAAAKGAVYDCWMNVNNEHFIVWMRVAGLPTFKKLWGRLDKDLPAGDYTLTIQNNFPVQSFEGKKAFVLSTTEWIGGKNNFLGVAYIVVGGICAVLACLFLIKQLVSPRQLQNPKDMDWSSR